MTREGSRVGLSPQKRVVEEAHCCSREVGAEGGVEAAVDGFSVRVCAERVRFGSRVVNPVSSDAVVLLENDDVVAFTLKLACGDEA